jgi:hypothetical protein
MKNANFTTSLQEVTNAIEEFVMPVVVEGILRQRTIASRWRPGGPWRRAIADE